MWLLDLLKEKPDIKSFELYFSFRFEDVPDLSFASVREADSEGIESTIYRKVLKDKESGIFDTAEVVLNPAYSKKIILKTCNTKRLHWVRVKRLVNHIYLFLGEDDENKGKWDFEDKQQFETGIFWARYWLEERHNPKIMLSLSKAPADVDSESVFELSLILQ